MKEWRRSGVLRRLAAGGSGSDRLADAPCEGGYAAITLFTVVELTVAVGRPQRFFCFLLHYTYYSKM